MFRHSNMLSADTAFYSNILINFRNLTFQKSNVQKFTLSINFPQYDIAVKNNFMGRS